RGTGQYRRARACHRPARGGPAGESPAGAPCEAMVHRAVQRRRRRAQVGLGHRRGHGIGRPMTSRGRSRSDEVRHVLIVTNALAPDKLGGLERYVRELAAGLVRQGLQVTVLTKRVHPEHPAREVGPDGVAVVRHDVPSKRLRTFALRYPFHVAAAIWREVGHLDPGTVVHAHYAMPALPLALRDIPYLYTFHAPVYREALDERQGSYALPRVVQAPAVASLKRAESLVVRRASRVLVLSRYMQGELARLSKRAAASSIQIPGGIDTQQLSPGPAHGDD